MNLIDSIREELREIMAQDTYSESDLRRIGMLETRLEQALIRYDY